MYNAVAAHNVRGYDIGSRAAITIACNCGTAAEAYCGITTGQHWQRAICQVAGEGTTAYYMVLQHCYQCSDGNIINIIEAQGIQQVVQFC